VDVFGTRNVLGLTDDPAVLVVLVSSIAVTRPEWALDSGGTAWAGRRLRRSWCAGAVSRTRSSGRAGLSTDRRGAGSALARGDVLDGRLSRRALADVSVQLLRHREAHRKTFEVVEGGGDVRLDWGARFGELELDAGWRKLVAN
jgi:hypothetical protein